MTEENNSGVTRRGFITAAGAAGLGTVLASTVGLAAGETKGGAAAQPAAGKDAKVATRKYGKTGVDVSMLSIGGMFDIPNNLALMKRCLDWGVTYWDTADCYEGGKSEEGIGMFFEKFPDARKQVFLVSKSDARDPAGMTKLLDRSLQRLKTDHIDLYFIHGVNEIKEINAETKAWAEKAKADKKIKFFGFSAHKNMEALLSEAAKLGWIDGVMITYNFRMVHDDKMKAAVEAAVKAGIGITAMKTMGGGQVKADNEAELKLGGRFLSDGFTEQQAKLKAVWENKQISAICSQMPNMTILQANVAAALDKQKLTASEWDALKTYAKETASTYCAGCYHHCETAAGNVPISEVMRYMMYHTSYGETHMARQLFAALPVAARDALARLDLAAVERACPRGLPVAQIVRDAGTLLA